MKKLLRIALIALLAICFIALVGCSNDGYVENGGEGSYNFAIGGRKIAYSVDLTLNVTDVSKAGKAVDGKVNDMHGYVEFANDIYDQEDIYCSSRVYRIPTDSLNEFIDYVEEQGGVTGKNISLNDFTQEYVNASSRKTALINKRTALSELLSDGTVSASDKLVIINEITSVDEQLEIINITLSEYDETADYSTVYVDFNALPSVMDVIMPIVIFLIIPAIVLGAIFIPKAIIRRRRAKKLKTKQNV